MFFSPASFPGSAPSCLFFFFLLMGSGLLLCSWFASSLSAISGLACFLGRFLSCGSSGSSCFRLVCLRFFCGLFWGFFVRLWHHCFGCCWALHCLFLAPLLRNGFASASLLSSAPPSARAAATLLTTAPTLLTTAPATPSTAPLSSPRAVARRLSSFRLGFPVLLLLSCQGCLS